MKKFKIYSSSAGSGKTYTLTKEYLKLALKTNDSVYFKKILAITFTNDAANEMKERVLSILKSFSELELLPPGEQLKITYLLQTIVDEINSDYPEENVTIEIIKERARKTHKKIINDYSEFAIGTIDSFTNRIVSAFTEELNLPYNYEIDLDAKSFLQNSVDRLINKAGDFELEDQKKLSDTLEEFIQEKIASGESLLSFPTDLTKFGCNLFDETVIDAIESLKSLNLSDFDEIRVEMRQKINSIEKEIKSIADLVVSSFRKLGLSIAHFEGKSRGIANYFESLAEEVIESILSKDFSNVLASGKISNNGVKKNEIDLVNSLFELFNDSYFNIKKLAEEYLSLKAVYQHLYKISVLHQLDKELEGLKREKNIVHISDFNKKIISIVLNEPVPFIYERLGEKYNHILIDEFQDTSVLQWNNLMPLIENSLGYEHLNLIVGDAKQAIYSWRGGDLKQIVHLSKGNVLELVNQQEDNFAGDLLEQRYDTIKNHISPQLLNTNFRSKAEIINFNNDFFKVIADLYQSRSEALAHVYDESFQQTLPENKKVGGHVEISFINTKDDLFIENEYKLETSVYIKNTLFNIKKIIDEALINGYPYKDIAILCRSNSKSKYIAEFLFQNKIKVISSDSLLLKSASSIRFIISIFKIVENPNDILLKYECIQLFHILILNRLPGEFEQKTIEIVVRDKNIDLIYSYFQTKNIEIDATKLSQSSIYDLTESVIRVFNLLSIPQQSPFIYRFLDVILEFSVKKSNNLPEFMEYWETKNDQLSINTPKDWNAITVTTIHKSKGLEYPVVIVAFADWSLCINSKSFLWINLSKLNYQPNSFSASKLSHVAVRAVKELENTIFKEDYQAKQANSFIENLNLMYVAFTRAVDRLYILSEDENNLMDKSRSSFKVVDLLYNYLDQKHLWNELNKNYIIQQGGQKNSESREIKKTQAFLLNNTPTTDWKQKIKITDHSQEDIFDKINFDKRKEWFNKLIYVLINIKTKNDIDKIVQKMFFNGVLDKKEILDMKVQLLKIVENEKISKYFASGLNIIAEKQILNRFSTSQALPDRIIIENDKAIIIIFRSEEINEVDKQIFANYRNLLDKMHYKRVDAIYIDIVKINLSFFLN